VRYIFLFLLLHNFLFAIASPIDKVINWAEQGYKDFRTYPRVNKAYELIDDNKTKEAKTLLKKALEIDKHNQRAIDLMLNICLNEKNQECIDKYINRAKGIDLGYVYKQKAQNAKEIEDYQKAIEYAKKALKYKLERDDRYFVKLIIFDSYLKQKEYLKADDFINRRRLITYQILKWSKVSDNLGDSIYAYDLASELPNKAEYLKWQIELLLKNKEYKEASKKMEILYKIEPTLKNKKQLLYLYSLTNQDENIVKVYQQKLAKGCDEYSLNFLLNYYRDNLDKKYKILKQNYPYKCVKGKKRVQLSLEFINMLKKRNPKRAKRVAKELLNNSDIALSKKEKILLYQSIGEDYKIAKLYKKELNNGNCNRDALLYLLDFYRGKPSKYNKILEEYYPYSCLSPKKRNMLSLQLANIMIDKDKTKAQEILSTIDIKEIEPKSYMNISNLEAKLKNYNESIRYALEYLKYYPNDAEAIKHVGFLYFKLNQKERSAFYLMKASKLNPNDVELLKNIGYLCVDLKEYDTATYYWNLYLKKRKKDAKIKLELASLYFYQLKNYKKAKKYLKEYEKSTKSYTPEFYLLKAKLSSQNQNCKVAIDSYRKALKLKKDDSIMYEYAHTLYKCNQKDKAIKIMQKLANKTDNIQYKKELAYMYEKEKQYSKAIDNFKYITKENPKANNHLALAYAYKKVGRDEDAIKEFKKAIDSNPNMDKKKLKNIKSEIANSKRFHAYIAESIRLDGDKKSQSTKHISNATYNGFGSIEFSYKPKFLPKRTTLFANILHNHQNPKESFQPSIGVRYQPIKNKQFYISATKLIKGGKSSRNDTLFRASLGISCKDDSNRYQNLYIDGGYFAKSDSIVTYSNYEVGKRYDINKNIKISPYVTTGATYNNDNSQKKGITNLDIGVGVAVDILPNETKYEISPYRNRLKLEAREKYAGNSKDKNTLHLQWEFFY
jgi:tetratricopeptide (TPR) repeat protein